MRKRGENETAKKRGEKETARKRDIKETARKANRDQREANARRNRSAAEKQVDGFVKMRDYIAREKAYAYNEHFHRKKTSSEAPRFSRNICINAIA